MRRSIAVLVTLAVISLAPTYPQARAASDKQLQSMRGDVAYQRPNGAVQSLAVHATVSLQDSDYAITSANSLAGIDLPDSSRILIGSQTKIQLAYFNQTNIANAKFIIYNGKTRFTVEHPQGARANYTFQTPTAQIAVRGTEGDIDVEPGLLQVNVYQLSDPSLPVRITLNTGQIFTLGAGESLLLHFPISGLLSAGQLQSTQSAISRVTYHPFQEFGMPANAHLLGLVAPHLFLTGLFAAIIVDAVVIAAANHPAPQPRQIRHIPQGPAPFQTPSGPLPTAQPTIPPPNPSPSPSVPIIIQSKGFSIMWIFRI